MNVSQLHRGMPNYPDRLSILLGDQAPSTLWVSGDQEILHRLDDGKWFSIALMASVDSPGSMLQPTLETIHSLCDATRVFIGGFHSPLEKLSLQRLIREQQSVVICMARTLVGMRLPAPWQRPLAEGRLVLVSPFSQAYRRPTLETARVRNELVVTLSAAVLIAFAAKGSKTEQYCQSLLRRGKPMWAIDSIDNASLLSLGIPVYRPGVFEGMRQRAAASIPHITGPSD